VQRRAVEFSKKIRSEKGVDATISAFHTHLPRGNVIPCAIFPDRVATFLFTAISKAGTKSKSAGVKHVYLSPLAATFLRKHIFISSSAFDSMQMHRYIEYNIASGPYEPVSGAAWAILDLLYDSFKGMGERVEFFLRLDKVFQGVRVIGLGAAAAQRVKDGSIKRDFVGNFYRALVQHSLDGPKEFLAVSVHVWRNFHLYLGGVNAKKTVKQLALLFRQPGNKFG